MNRRRQPKRDAVSIELKALRRAAAEALDLARRSGTPCYVLENGKLVDLTRIKADASSKPKN